MNPQCFGQLLPMLRRKSKPAKKPCFAPAKAMRGIEQIIHNLFAFNNGLVCVGQFHLATISRTRLPIPAHISIANGVVSSDGTLFILTQNWREVEKGTCKIWILRFLFR
jgi:hypothetical protein